MNNQEFIKAQRFFDNTLIGKHVFPDEYAYVEAGVLMKKGDIVAAYEAFNAIDNVQIPTSIITNLREDIYLEGQRAYHSGDTETAKTNFTAIKDYKRSKDYLLLITCKKRVVSPDNYSPLVALIGFEDADDIILNRESFFEKFLLGRWEDGASDPFYFELEKDGKSLTSTSRYNLPRNETEGFFDLKDGIYSVKGTKYWRFSIIDEDTISVYCFKDGRNITLYRQ